MRPPGLAWIEGFCKSTGEAMGQPIVAEVRKTVNPLTYAVRLKWREPTLPGQSLLIWNLFQKWAAINESIPSGRIQYEEATSPYTNFVGHMGMRLEVSLKERLGHPKEKHP
jgi:hypothetical protein